MKQSEIKFRAWNGKEMVFISDVHTLEIEEKGRWFVMYGGKLFCNYLNGQLMQYTGIKDQTGKDVYGCDILEFRDDHVPEEPLIKGLVLWDRGSFVIAGADRLWEMRNADDSFDFTVKGNKYENGHLL